MSTSATSLADYAQGCIYPLEVVQTRLSVSPKGTYSGISDALSKIVRLEGSKALFRGLTPTMLGIGPYAGALPADSYVSIALFYFFEKFKVF